MKLSTGQDSTLGVYIALASLLWGDDSPSVKFLRNKAAESPNGLSEPVIAHETQMIAMLADLHERGSIK